MIVYLSCDVRNEFFIKAVSKAIRKLTKLLPNAIEFIYPPKKIGGDTGKVLNNVLRVREADVVIIDVTPKIARRGEPQYNSGVMIEYGIVLALDKPREGAPWGGKQPKPTYRVFCNRRFPRTNLTPIVNEESVTAYDSTRSRTNRLGDEIARLFSEQATQIMNFTKLGTTMRIPITLQSYPFEVHSVP